MTYYIFFTMELLDFVHHMVFEVILSIFYIKVNSNLFHFSEKLHRTKNQYEHKTDNIKIYNFYVHIFKYRLNKVYI
jgi:uncharacterized membrane protein YciS (DUF1049 family)